MSTIYDVAKRAGVSPATVSNAFNKPHLIKPQTLERILAVAREVNYRPNLFARALASGSSRTVGLLVSDIRYPYTASVARGIEDKLAQEGYSTLIANTDGDPHKTQRLAEQLYHQGISGLILVPAHHSVGVGVIHTVKSLIAAKVPVIFVGSGAGTSDPQIETVSFQPQQATRELVEHLIGLGHRGIAFVGGEPSRGMALPRWLGYQQGLLSNQIPLRNELVKETEVTPAAGRKALAELLALPAPPTAVFALSDVVASGIIDLCFERGIRLPKELSVVSFDYGALAQRTTPGITSIVVPVYEVGHKAAELFVQRTLQPDSPPQHAVMEYHLSVRDTTAPPRVLSVH